MVYDSQTQYGLFMMEEGCVCVWSRVWWREREIEETDI